jgi:benzil reductase ((S)-benzoin forming)
LSGFFVFKRNKKKVMIYIVTGVSRGLGKAIAECFLKDGHKVIGVGRSHSIDHENFRFQKCDFSDRRGVEQCMKNEDFTSPVTLINNAGILGEIGRISQKETFDLPHVLDVNVNAPFQLIANVYGNMRKKSDFTLVNISSGAANRAIPSWASYCASKSALNMLTEAFYLEEHELGNTIRAYALSPGVIDTDMQGQIRAASPNVFSSVEKFKSLREDGMLVSAEEAAIRLKILLEQPFDGTVFHDLRMLK